MLGKNKLPGRARALSEENVLVLDSGAFHGGSSRSVVSAEKSRMRLVEN